jgi:hypothetical protein
MKLDLNSFQAMRQWQKHYDSLAKVYASKHKEGELENELQKYKTMLQAEMAKNKNVYEAAIAIVNQPHYKANPRQCMRVYAAGWFFFASELVEN